MTDSSHVASHLARLQWSALLVGLVCLGVCVVGGVLGTPHWFRAYLYAYLFWLGVPLGALCWIMIHQLTGGAWGRALRPLALRAAQTLPLLVVLFVPITLGLPSLYLWADPQLVAHSPVLQHKQPYLNIPFFLLRSFGYLLLWTVLAFVLTRWLARGTPRSQDRARRCSAGGLVLYEVTMTLAGIDWIMSRNESWYSTIFGFMVTAGQALTGLAFLILFLAVVFREPAFRRLVEPSVLIDLGNLLLVAVVLWSYLAFAQLLIIWLGNIREETTWYAQRGMGQAATTWRWVGLALIVFHFFVPFFLLLFRDLKRRLGFLVCLAGLLLVMRLVDNYWLVAPSGLRQGPHWDLSWIDVLMPVGMGGLWVACFVFLLGRYLPTPASDRA